jgi:hypothetical protein
MPKDPKLLPELRKPDKPHNGDKPGFVSRIGAQKAPLDGARAKPTMTMAILNEVPEPKGYGDILDLLAKGRG